ncbi:hypothetical protein Tco_0645134, partial [Tanacetum coccineum]
VKQDEKEKENEEAGKEHNIIEKEVENETNAEAGKTDELVREKVVAKLTGAKINEMIKTEMPHLIKLAVDKDREVS